MKNIIRPIIGYVIFSTLILSRPFLPNLYPQAVKEPCVAGTFYPADPKELSAMINGFLEKAGPGALDADIFALISPHAGFGYSGQVAAFGYKLIKDKPFKTVVILGTSHNYPFSGCSVYPEGIFKTPLGRVAVDAEFASKLLGKDPEITFDPEAFRVEHSVEVQLPFLQMTLPGFSGKGGSASRGRVVPIVLGDCSLSTCQKLATLLKEAIGKRKDVLVVASTDMYHGYDYEEADAVDNLTLSAITNMDAEGLYYGLRDQKMQLCGGFGVVTMLILAKDLGRDKIKVLKHTNSGEVTGKKNKGIWTVGYSSCAIYSSPGKSVPKSGEKNISASTVDKSRVLGGAGPGLIGKQGGERAMLNKSQRKELLDIARNSIESYLKTGKKPEFEESDPLFLKAGAAFVTLSEGGSLRGCIGSLTAREPLYLTVRDMAIEAATGDPRFNRLDLSELKKIDIEISVLSPMQKIDKPDDIQLGKHGVMVRKGFSSGVFLPQVAAETGWSKEEFMSNLCSHKAGLEPDAWKDKATEIYVFTAEVFSEKNY